MSGGGRHLVGRGVVLLPDLARHQLVAAALRSNRTGCRHGGYQDPGADPYSVDSDGDGLSDGQEQDGLEIYISYWDDSLGDYSYYTDYVYTDPADADSDDDGWPDGWERANGYNPVDPTDGNKDSDGDGVSDGMEAVLGADANDASDGNVDSDGDGDGVGNATEIALGTNPGNKADGMVDSDGDGVINAQEVVDGTNPGDAASFVKPADTGTGSPEQGPPPTIRVMIRSITTQSDQALNGQTVLEGQDETWLEDDGWTTLISGANGLLDSGDESIKFETIQVAHNVAKFPASDPNNEQGWVEHGSGGIIARASASSIEGAGLGELGARTYYKVEAKKIEVKNEVSRQFLKGTKVDEADEIFEGLKLTIDKNKRESKTYELDPDLLRGKTSEMRLLPVEIDAVFGFGWEDSGRQRLNAKLQARAVYSKTEGDITVFLLKGATINGAAER